MSSSSFQSKKGVASLRSSIIPLQGEMIWTTDTHELFMGDGVTPGGIVPTNLAGYPVAAASISARNSLSTRIAGMSVRVTSNGINYGLLGGTSNANWNSALSVQLKDTISSLSLINGADLTNNTPFYVRGQSTIDDGGEGDFYFNSSSSATADGIDVALPADAVGRFLRKRLGRVRLAAATPSSIKDGDLWYDASSKNIFSRLDGSNVRLNHDPRINTAIELKAIPSSSKNTFVALLGIDAPFDFGGGLYSYVLGTASSDEPRIYLPNDYASASVANKGYWQKFI